MIVVARAAGPLGLGATGGDGSSRLAGRAARIAVAAAAAGARVELVGSVGDDPEGDVAVRRARSGRRRPRGPAARPVGRTALDEDGRLLERGPRSRLDAGTSSSGCATCADCTVLVVAEDSSRRRAGRGCDAAAYHGARSWRCRGRADDDGTGLAARRRAREPPTEGESPPSRRLRGDGRPRTPPARRGRGPAEALRGGGCGERLGDRPAR